MKFAFDEGQEALKESAGKFLNDFASSEQTRKAMESQCGYDIEVWRRVAEELGWTAVNIPEMYGGFGLGYVELIALMEEMGKRLFCSPFFSTVVFGANALLVAGTDAQKRSYLPLIAGGKRLMTLASTGRTGDWSLDGVTTVASANGDTLTVTGEEGYVLDGASAHWFVVAVRAPETCGEDGVGLVLIPADATGVNISPLTTMDMTRRMARVSFDGVSVGPESVMLAPGEGALALQKIYDLASIAQSAEQLGGAEACLEMAVSYAKVREQFGRPIGSFQAVKHMCADMFVKVAAARSACYYAGWLASQEGADLSRVASMANAYCSEAYFFCAATSVQVHGGIGFTWEHDAHLFFKRARASEQFLGGPAFHRERYAQNLLM